MLAMNQDLRAYGDVQMTGGLTKLYDALLSALKGEIEIYGQLLIVVENERLILKSPSVDELLASNSRKDTIILKAKMLEEAKTKIVKKIVAFTNLDDGEVNLSTLAAYADTHQRIRIRECQACLRDILERIEKINRNNSELIHLKLRVVDGSMSFINRLISSTGTYAGYGQMKTVSNNGRLLRMEG